MGLPSAGKALRELQPVRCLQTLQLCQLCQHPAWSLQQRQSVEGMLTLAAEAVGEEAVGVEAVAAEAVGVEAVKQRLLDFPLCHLGVL